MPVCREFNSKSNGENHFEKGHSIKKLWLKNWLKLLFFGPIRPIWPKDQVRTIDT